MASDVNYSKVLGYLMKSWAICNGCLTLLCVLGYWLHPLWLPLVAFAAMVIVQVFNNKNSRGGVPYCPLFTVCTNYSLVITFVVMVVINLLNSRWLIDTEYGTRFSHPSMPFISTLIVYPAMIISYGYALYIRGDADICKACRESAGYSISDTLERNLFHHEVKFQMRLSFWVAVAMAAVTWTYYLIYYINVNINTPDAFYFFALPGMLYVLSLLYFFMKYQSLDFEIQMGPGVTNNKYHTLEHYMIVRDDKLLLSELEIDGMPIGLWDSPAVVKKSYVTDIPDNEAKADFESLSGATGFKLRRLFVTTTEKQNCFHYAVFLDSDADMPKLNGKWCTLLDVDKLLKDGKITRQMAYELHRVYTMTMAWKTYDREGRRLYAIRNYRPTFKLIDFKNWDLDYSDLHWLAVAQNNEDKRFYKLRRFWRHYISGTEWLWKKRG